MNFQLHLPHGLLLFLGLACLLSFVGFKGARFLTRKSSSSTAEDRMGNTVGFFAFIAFGLIASLVALVMLFTCPYAAYPALAAVLLFAMAFGFGSLS